MLNDGVQQDAQSAIILAVRAAQIKSSGPLPRTYTFVNIPSDLPLVKLLRADVLDSYEGLNGGVRSRSLCCVG